MKKNLVQAFTTVFIILLSLTACSKKDQVSPPPVPNKPVEKDIKVLVKAFIEVGEVMYDSIPATLVITSWDAQEVATTREINLAPGANEITLGGKYVKHLLKMSQWNTIAEKEVMRKDLKDNLLITIGTQKPAKKLKSEALYRMIQGTPHLLSYMEYHFNPDGSLKQINYFQKELQGRALVLTHKDRFTYEGGKLTWIEKLNAGDEALVFTMFEYGAHNKLSNIHVDGMDGFGQQRIATIHRENANGVEKINIETRLSNGQTLNYNMRFEHGNLLSDYSQSSTGASERGTYAYDLNINPFRQMNWPDLYLKHTSKNNRISESKTFEASHPSAILDKSVYTYDVEGYPREVISSYKSSTGEHMYENKTIYEYYIY